MGALMAIHKFVLLAISLPMLSINAMNVPTLNYLAARAIATQIQEENVTWHTILNHTEIPKSIKEYVIGAYFHPLHEPQRSSDAANLLREGVLTWQNLRNSLPREMLQNIAQAYYQPKFSADESELDLRDKGLTSIECIDVLPGIEHVRVLRLSNNQLTTLPAEIGNLINLRGLALRNNQLITLPAEIGNLTTNLQALGLGKNQLPLAEQACIRARFPFADL